MELIDITSDNVDLLVEQFGKVFDGDTIIDPETGEAVRCRYTGVVLTRRNLGGILPGSTIFIVDDDYAYAAYIAEFLVQP